MIEPCTRTKYTYDAMHRTKTVAYSNGDPTVSINYDETNCLGLTACQNIGKRTSMTDAAGSEIWSYQVDSTNHRSVHKDQRTTNSITKTATYYLDYTGNVTQAVYPTGRIVNYTYDNANRPSTAADSANGITYATGLKSSPGGTCFVNITCYTPQGAVYSVSIGQTSSFNGLNITESFNNRLQPLEIKASSTGGNAIDITYNFVDPTTSKNAGHVYGITNNLDTTRSQTFGYDQMYRIVSAQTTSTHATAPTKCWAEVYALDAWANLNSIAASTNSNYTGCTQEGGFSQTADGNNHLSGFGYDASGNTSGDGVNSYTWNGESQMKTAAGVTYTYDGDGRRVQKSSGKLYWYGAGSEILAETNASGTVTAEYIFFAGKRVAELPAGGNAQYYVEDLLGTSRVVTTNTGVVCYDADFYPYGGERSYTNTCTNVYKFEGKERDTESGNDNFGARSYSNRFGRWLSSDWSALPVPVPYANLANPQTLNLYSMVGDDPESFADLDGHDRLGIPAASPGATTVNGASGQLNRLNQQVTHEPAVELALANAAAAEAEAAAEAAKNAASTAQNTSQTQSQQEEKKGVLQKIADSVFIEGAVGVGLGIKVNVEGGSVNAEASMKSQGEVTLSGKVDVSVVKDAKLTVESAGVEVGVGKSKETVTVKDGKALPVHEKKPTETVWGWKLPGAKGSSSVSGNKHTVFQVGVCVLLCVEVGVGIQK